MSSEKSFPLEQRSIRIFGVEVGGMDSPFWVNPTNGYNVAAFNKWKSTKRSFTHQEVIKNPWLIITYQSS